MEVQIDDEYDFKVNFSTWCDADRLSLIDDIVNKRKTSIIGHLCTTVEVEPPERDEDG